MSTSPSRIRIDRFIARAAGLSRKEVTRLIRQRRVTVNGEPVVDGQAKLSSTALAETMEIDGEPVDISPPPLLAAYHKPLGVLSTMSDNWGRADLSTALDDAPPSWAGVLHPVGRLDADTSGLLLFSSDGKLSQRLLHPKHGTEKEYLATVGGDAAVLEDGAEALRATLAAGIATTEGRHVADLIEARPPDEASLAAVAATAALGASHAPEADDAAGAGAAATPVATLRLVVREGKHRMVRRMLANAGHPVLALHRTRFGAVVLDSADLPPGGVRAIDADAL